MNPPVPHEHADLERSLAELSADEARGLRDVWHLAADVPEPDILDPKAISRTERVLAVLVAGPRTPKNDSLNGRPAGDRPARPTSRRIVRRLAAGATALALAATLWLSLPVVIRAPAGAHVAVVLPDGSTVTLNSGSTLRRARLMGNQILPRRSVRLEGEAFFDVAPGTAPFIVRTADAEVIVLGTRFGVRSWTHDGEDATTVALLSGLVRLVPAGQPRAAVVLRPGQVARTGPGTPAPVVESGGVEDALAWRAGDLVYKDRPLSVILRDVERRYGVVMSARPDALGLRRASVALRDPASAEVVVRDLATALRLRYRRVSGGFELFDAGTI